MTVKNGDKLKVEYTGMFDNGEVFDSSEKHGQALEFVAGEGKVIKGFDEAVIGMKLNEEKKFNISMDKAYGPYNDQLVQMVSRDQLPKEHEPKIGMVLMMKLPNGQQFPARITEVSDSDVKLDLNHPLAGKDLVFKIKVVGIN